MPREIGSTRHVPYKVLDTWIYKVKDVELESMDYVPPDGSDEVNGKDTRPESERHTITRERIVNRTVKVELRIEKKTLESEEPPHPTKEVKLEVVCAELGFKLEGTDIEALRAAMWGLLDKRFEIKWERYFLVKVNKTRIYQGMGAGLELVYDDVWKGTTWDGKLLLKKWEYRREFTVSPWPGEFKDTNGDVKACIPATEANEQALKEFARRIGLLQEKLADFLRPDKIMATLANLSGLALLPQGSAKNNDVDA